jgi:hypothetical protein
MLQQKKTTKKRRIYTSLGFFWNNRITLKININESYIIIIVIIWIGFHDKKWLCGNLHHLVGVVEFTREKTDYFTFKVNQIGAQLDDLVLLLTVIKH